MAKLKNPLLSLGAVGRLAKDIVFARRRKVDIVEAKPIPEDAKSQPQLSWRHMYQKAVALWNALSASEKQEWESLARPKHMTGFAWFISQALKPNPGLYLPLQGGTMSGDIDMAKHRLIKLPAPVDNQEAARLADLFTATFLALTDTPADYTGQALKHVRVNPTESALQFVRNTFLALLDVPASYAGEALKMARVNAAENALEFAAIAALASKIILTTRDMTAPAGDVSYTGVGFQPTTLICFACHTEGAVASWGVADSALVEQCMSYQHFPYYTTAGNSLIIIYPGVGALQGALVKSYDVNGFTLTWSKLGSPTGTASLLFLALK